MRKSLPAGRGPLKDRGGKPAPSDKTGGREQLVHEQAAGLPACLAGMTKAGRFLDADGGA